MRQMGGRMRGDKCGGVPGGLNFTYYFGGGVGTKEMRIHIRGRILGIRLLCMCPDSPVMWEVNLGREGNEEVMRMKRAVRTGQ